jgi:hypothetical protein
MTPYHYKVIPAPTRGVRGKGVKGAGAKFANALEQVMNEMGVDGWEYQRSETLPCEERTGITSKTTVFRNVLVFRRPIETDISAFEPKLLDAPVVPIVDEIDPPILPDTPPSESITPDTETENNDATGAPDLNDPLNTPAEQLSKSD